CPVCAFCAPPVTDDSRHNASASVFRLVTIASLSRSVGSLRRARLNERSELVLERFDDAGAPGIGDRQGCRVWKNVVFAFFQPVENAPRGILGRGVRYV